MEFKSDCNLSKYKNLMNCEKYEPKLIYSKHDNIKTFNNENNVWLLGGSWTNTNNYTLRKLICEENIFPFKIGGLYEHNGIFLAPSPVNHRMYSKNLNQMVYVDVEHKNILLEFSFNNNQVTLHEYKNT